MYVHLKERCCDPDSQDVSEATGVVHTWKWVFPMKSRVLLFTTKGSPARTHNLDLLLQTNKPTALRVLAAPEEPMVAEPGHLSGSPVTLVIICLDYSPVLEGAADLCLQTF